MTKYYQGKPEISFGNEKTQNKTLSHTWFYIRRRRSAKEPVRNFSFYVTKERGSLPGPHCVSPCPRTGRAEQGFPSPLPPSLLPPDDTRRRAHRGIRARPRDESRATRPARGPTTGGPPGGSWSPGPRPDPCRRRSTAVSVGQDPPRGQGRGGRGAVDVGA